MKTANEILTGLDHFNGSEEFTRHGVLRNMLMTEGVMWLAESAQCHWLMDVIASHQLSPKVKAEEFQVWVLKRQDDSSWLITCDDGDGNIVANQHIVSSDFPLPEIKLYAEIGSVNGVDMVLVLMLPGER